MGGDGPGPQLVWSRAAATTGKAMVVLDIDSSLHEIHSENKELTAPTSKGGFGFHPMYCFADGTGETLAMRLRWGNGGANNVIDLVGVLDAAIDRMLDLIAAGHRVGDDPALFRQELQVRADSAAGRSFVLACRRNVGFGVVARSNDQIHAAIIRVA